MPLAVAACLSAFAHVLWLETESFKRFGDFIYKIEHFMGTFAMVLTLFTTPGRWTLYLNIIGIALRTGKLTLLSLNSVSGPLGSWLSSVRASHVMPLNQAGNFMS